MFNGQDLGPSWPALVVLGLIGYAVCRLVEWVASHLSINWA